MAEWAALWVDTLDVEIRTEENYRSRIRNVNGQVVVALARIP